MRRRKMSYKKSRRTFTKKTRINKRNLGLVSRGGKRI